MNLFCFVLFSARSGGRGDATLLSTPFCANPALPTLLCQPSFANPALPTLLCQPSFANPALPTLLCQPCFADPALPTLLCQPCFADPALPTLLCQPCFANPALLNPALPTVGFAGPCRNCQQKLKTKVLGQPWLCKPSAQLSHRHPLAAGPSSQGPTKNENKSISCATGLATLCQPFANPLPIPCQPFANPVANPKNRWFL